MTDPNPLLDVTPHPRFDCIDETQAAPAVQTAIADAGRRIDEIEATRPTAWGDLMRPLEEAGEPLDFAWGTISHLLKVMNSPAWREAHDRLQPDVVAFSLRVAQSRPIFECMEALRDGPEKDALQEPQRRVLESGIRSARLAGVGLDEAARPRFNEIQRELARLSTTFMNNVLDATKAYALELDRREDTDGLPPSLLAACAQAARAAGHADATADEGPWCVTLAAPILIPFLKYSRRRDLRETLYRAYIARASTGEYDNQPVVERILALRREKAGLLGYRTPAEVSLVTKMAANTQDVDDLLEALRRAARPHAERELEALRAYARAHGQTEPLMHWDLAFWGERLRETRFGFTDETLRPYFQFPRVLDGLFQLAEHLFDIHIRAADGEVPVWHPDVRFFRVDDADGNPLASFYLDPYSRPETKSDGAWFNPSYARRRRVDGRLERPVGYLVCNQTLPDGDRPSLMTFREVETLFHEFGHSLQHLLTTVDEPQAAGINNVEWDAVELPSQFMENWCYHRATVKGISRHIDTGESLPDDLFEQIRAARVFQSGLAMLRQLYFGMLDMELHHRYMPDDGDTLAAVKERIAAQATVLPPLPEDRFLCSFSHLFAGGYAAGYYSYKWAEVLSADAFGAFEEAGLDDAEAVREVGMRFRETVLSLGGGKHPSEIFRLFRGRDPEPGALLRQMGLDRPPAETC